MQLQSQDKSNGPNQGGPTQRASALAALSSAFNSSPSPRSSTASRPSGMGQGSQRAAAVAALSQVLTAEKKRSPDASPVRSTGSPAAEASPFAGTKSENALSEVEDSKEASEAKEIEVAEPLLESNGEDSGPKQDVEQDENGSEASQSTFSYEQLKAHSDNPVTGIDFKRREAYLSDEEFQAVMGITKEAFYKLPKWKQDMNKKKFDLF
ncbi:Caps the barbed end of actin filaments and is able to sever them in a calcium-dependent manner [Sarracenia purpurea var. burkii]